MKLAAKHVPAVLILSASLLFPVAAPAAGESSQVSEALARQAIKVSDPKNSFLVAVDKAGERIVLAGERGLILFSDDQGRNWTQALVPVSVTLTSVRFADAQYGMATGHGGVVLGTVDGGEHWSLLLDGRRAAQLALEQAQASGDTAAIKDAELLVAEGPDKPFLDLLVQDRLNALVVGAYGLVFRTSDGGRNWEPLMGRLDNPGLRHFYSIRQRGEQVLLVGEQGLANISSDNGNSFARLAVPYEGSFFTGEILPSGELVAAGLKGNVWRSNDGGQSWIPVDTVVNASITDSEVLPDGTLLLSTQAGVFVAMKDNALLPTETKLPSPVNAFVSAGQGQLLVLSTDGIRQVDPGVK